MSSGRPRPSRPEAGYSSFAVESLRRIGGFDEQSEVPEVIAAYRLRAAGFTGTRVPGWVVARSTPRSPAAFLRQRYDVGRAAAGAGVVRVGRAHVRRGMDASSLGVRLVSGAGAAATVLGAARQRLARR